MLPGRYNLTIGDPALATFGFEKPVVRRIDVGTSPETVKTVKLPTMDELLEGCAAGHGEGIVVTDSATAGAILGRAIINTGRGVAGRVRATVTLPARSAPVDVRGPTDANGRFRLCGVPGGVHAAIVFEGDDGSVVEATVTVDPVTRIGLVTHVVPRR